MKNNAKNNEQRRIEEQLRSEQERVQLLINKDIEEKQMLEN